MLIIDDTLLPPLIAVLRLLDELARLRKFRSFGDLFPDSPSLFNPELCKFESLESGNVKTSKKKVKYRSCGYYLLDFAAKKTRKENEKKNLTQNWHLIV